MNTDDFFAENPNPQFTHSAPGRLDVMGGIADYSGSLVLPMPIQERVKVTLACRNDTIIRTYVQTNDQSHLQEIVSSEMAKPGNGADTTGIQPHTSTSWMSLVWAGIQTFYQTQHLSLTGMDIRIEVPIPLHQGLAERQAVTLALTAALAKMHSIALDPGETSLLAWQAYDSHSLHASLADFLVCELGQPTSLLPVLCQPGHVSAPVLLPDGIHFIAIDTGIALPTPNSIYETIKTASLIGYSMIALSDGAFPHELERARQTGNREELLYNGYLANITPTEFDSRYQWLPTHVKGSLFLEKSGILIDQSASIDPETIYPVKQATLHPIYENIRSQYFSLLLQHLPPVADAERREKSLQQLGTWMFQSHESYKACGLSHPQADALVQQVKTLAGKGVYGARLTDQGGGGTVCVLCEGEQGLEAVAKLWATF